MEQLIIKLKQDYPELVFTPGPLLCWSPSHRKVQYDPNGGLKGIWGLFHEIGHAQLQHMTYLSDIDLLQKEATAWQEANVLAKRYEYPIDDDHIQNCLDTYRDWLFRRSTCPHCHIKGVQETSMQYLCLNCHASWRVTPSRFCRPYRLRRTTEI